MEYIDDNDEDVVVLFLLDEVNCIVVDIIDFDVGIDNDNKNNKNDDDDDDDDDDNDDTREDNRITTD